MGPFRRNHWRGLHSRRKVSTIRLEQGGIYAIEAVWLTHFAILPATTTSNIVTASEEYALHIFPQVGEKTDSTAENIITDEAVTCLVVNRTDVYTGAADGIVRQYNIRTRESMGAVGRYDLSIRCLAQSPNGAYLAVGTA